MKKLLNVIVSLVVLVAVMAFLAPNDYTVERSVSINASKEAVYANISTFAAMDKWSPWNAKDPDMKKWMEGNPDGEVGAISKWEGDPESVGTGEQEFTEINANESVKMALRFKVPWESESDAWVKLSEGEEGATVATWGLSGSMPFPMDIMMMFGMMDMDAAV